MIVKSCPFNPLRDVTPVSQTGFIDLANAFAHNTVPSQLPGTDADYNGIEDPASILGKPTDVFHAMELESIVRERGSKSSEGGDAE